jgi:UDP-N-acetylmuramyl pentapeptide phosphotransferase/UDP-N-acetylglucosamine-1-phosphate transferase
LPLETRLTLAGAVGFAVAFAATALAARVAVATGFLDRPREYRVHALPTPCLGGAGVMGGVAAAAAVSFGGGGGRLLPIVAGTAALWAVGTLDDLITVAAPYRLAVAVAGGGLLWATQLGWSVTGSEGVDFTLTLAWTGAVATAYNLLDNIDGAAATTAAVAAAGIGVLAALQGDVQLGGLAFGLCGACLAFLHYNLASPARIFLGDGGSLPVGFLVAAGAMALSHDFGATGTTFLAAVLLAGVAIVDTSVVLVSRLHRRVPVYRGGRDHLTHRLLARLGSPRRVALTLAATQTALAIAAIAVLD